MQNVLLYGDVIMAKKDFKTYLPVLIPLLAAVLVVSTLAISGRVANKTAAPAAPTVTQEAATTEEAKPQDAKVTMVAVGDNLIHNTLIDAGKQDDGSLDYNSFYEEIKQYIEPADIAIINQETMLGGKDFEYSGYPMFNTPWEVGDAARAAGFDVFTCATNHAMDVGSAGILKELEYFKKHPEVLAVGTNESEAEQNTIDYYEKNGINFAFLNYTYGTNGISLPADKPYVVNMLKKEKVEKDIKEARRHADVVVVLPHWGTENSHEVNEQQKEYVKLFSSLGVDIVIGTHHHVLQPVEWVTNAETGKKMLVYYSIGNFISHQVNRNQMVGGMAEITVERKDGAITITNAKITPVIDYYKHTAGGYKFRVYRLSDYNDDLANSQAQDGLSVKYCTNLAKDIISEEFLDLT
ncbi:MAG: CapA family protein [Ruminococcaceae bacterium]|nr:CapA family protein [Oscillospiraceae bacterium]